MDPRFVQGFMDKCAAAGVDPEALVKSGARGDQIARALAAGIGNNAGMKRHPARLAKHILEKYEGHPPVRGSAEATRVAAVLKRARNMAKYLKQYGGYADDLGEDFKLYAGRIADGA